MEFSGACEGCGETPYAKLVTQMLGPQWPNVSQDCRDFVLTNNQLSIKKSTFRHMITRPSVIGCTKLLLRFGKRLIVANATGWM